MKYIERMSLKSVYIWWQKPFSPIQWDRKKKFINVYEAYGYYFPRQSYISWSLVTHKSSLLIYTFDNSISSLNWEYLILNLINSVSKMIKVKINIWFFKNKNKFCEVSESKTKERREPERERNS